MTIGCNYYSIITQLLYNNTNNYNNTAENDEFKTLPSKQILSSKRHYSTKGVQASFFASSILRFSRAKVGKNCVLYL